MKEVTVGCLTHSFFSLIKKNEIDKEVPTSPIYAGNGKYFTGSLVVTDGYVTCFRMISQKWQVPGKASAFLRKEIQKFPSHLPAARMQPQCLELLPSATLWQYFGHLMQKSWLIWKNPDDGKDWGQEGKGMTEDEMVGWHHWLNGHRRDTNIQFIIMIMREKSFELQKW